MSEGITAATVHTSSRTTGATLIPACGITTPHEATTTLTPALKATAVLTAITEAIKPITQ